MVRCRQLATAAIEAYRCSVVCGTGGGRRPACGSSKQLVAVDNRSYEWHFCYT